MKLSTACLVAMIGSVAGLGVSISGAIDLYEFVEPYSLSGILDQSQLEHHYVGAIFRGALSIALLLFFTQFYFYETRGSN